MGQLVIHWTNLGVLSAHHISRVPRDYRADAKTGSVESLSHSQQCAAEWGLLPHLPCSTGGLGGVRLCSWYLGRAGGGGDETPTCAVTHWLCPLPPSAFRPAPAWHRCYSPPPQPPGSQETDQLEEEKAELESEIAELQKEKERLEFVLVAHKPGCKIPFDEGPGPGPLAEVRDGPGPAPAKEDGYSWLLPPPPPPPLPFETGQDAPPNLTASLFTHSEVHVLGDPFPVVPPSYTSSFVLTCPEVSAFAGAQRPSGSDQPCDPLGSPSLLAL